jgi:diaminohydroxyphosphoribosylaminopyrimidine deaminase/5-amino-6-(5-phosphoribosylamino)uracil reductase
MDHPMYLNKAFILAKKANPKLVRPNPMVGALVVNSNGVILGEGYHQKAGGPHAEVFAIQQALQQTADLSQTTLYVTLEPCSHHGKTPPCTDLIIQHKIPRVVIGSTDPNPVVSGMEVLKQQGVEVLIIPHSEIAQLNRVFTVNQLKKRPFVQMKTAMTLDGKISDRSGKSKWITNETSRYFVHEKLRSQTDAILTTAATLITDNAKLDIRLLNEPAKELSVLVIDRDGDLLKLANRHLAVFYPRTHSKIYLLTKAVSEEAVSDLPPNVELIPCTFDENGFLKLEGLGEQLLQKGMYHLMTEAGAVLNTFLIQQQWADEWCCFVAPRLLMDRNAPSVFQTTQAISLEDTQSLTLLESLQLEGDVLLRYQINLG